MASTPQHPLPSGFGDGARVVALSSTGHELSPIRWDDAHAIDPEQAERLRSLSAEPTGLDALRR
jgi:hypothetical protein